MICPAVFLPQMGGNIVQETMLGLGVSDMRPR